MIHKCAVDKELVLLKTQGQWLLINAMSEISVKITFCPYCGVKLE
jgi:hypothetical protein